MANEMPIPTHLRELLVEGLLYNWLMDNGHTSEENAYSLSGLTQRSGTHVPGYMRRDGKLVNFFLDRPNIFGVVDYVVGSRGIQHPSIYAKESGKSYRQEQVIKVAADQADADARLSQFREYFAANAALEETERQRNSPFGKGYKWNEMLGGKSKSKSRSRSGRKSRRKSSNRNRRSKSKSRK
jgi:hypothetical protein